MTKFKNLIAIVFCVCSYVTYANELTSAQMDFQNSIKAFLREEGFVPSIDSDNSLTFKKEGVLYWIDISENSPFFLEFHRNGFNITDANMAAVIMACNQSNKLTKCVKCFASESTVAIVVEMYCHSDEEFKYIFYKSLKVLDSAYSTVKQYYNDYDNDEPSPFSISEVNVANVDANNNVITAEKATIYEYNTRYIRPSLTVNVEVPGTYDIYVKFYAPTGLSTGSNSPSGYTFKSSVTMASGVHTYTLSGWGNNTAGNWKKGNYKFEFYYEEELVGKKDFTVY